MSTIIDEILGDIGLPSVRAVSSRPRQRSSYTPEEEQSLLAKIGNTALSGLSVVGNVLDVPGSMVRDVLGGANPFDQLLSPTTGDNRLSGRDMLAKWGVTTPNDPNAWEAADFGGFAAELALDPFLPLSFGGKALGKGGQVAKQAGLMNDLAKIAPKAMGPREARLTQTLGDLLKPRAGEAGAGAAGAWNIDRGRKAAQAAEAMGLDLADVADQPLGGLVGVGTPFGAPSQTYGSVNLAKKLDEWGRRAQFAKIPGTDLAPLSALNRLFNANVGDASSQVGQRSVMPSIQASRKAARADARGAVGDVALDLMARGGNLANEDHARALRRLYEGVDVASTPEVAQHVDKVRGVLDPMIAEANDWGLYGSELFDSKINYFPRFMSKELRDVQGSRRIVSAFDPQMTGRHEYLKDLGQGTDTIYQMLEDPHIKYGIESGIKVDDLAQLIGNRFGADVPNAYINSATQSVENRREAIARWFMQMDDDVRASGVFGNHPVQDLAARLQSGYETLSVGKEVLRQLADPTTLREAMRTTRTPGQFVKLKQVLEKIGFVSGDENGGALKKFLELTGHANADKKIIDAAGSIPVPADFADDLNRYMQSFKSPEAANEILQAVDSVTNLFKGGVTAPWPAFHVRNLFSGQWQNWAAGQWSMKSLRDANAIMRGQSSAELTSIPVVRSELQRLGLQATPENAADVVRRMAWQHNVVSKYESLQAAGAPTAVGSTFGDFLTELPGGVAQGRGTPFQPTDAIGMLRGQGTTWNPVGSTMQGVGGATQTTFAPLAAGQHLGHYIEGLNRLTPFIENLRKGVDPAEAAARVAATQVDYAGRAYTAFEKGVAARLFPFYKFSKGMVPYTLSRLWESPGGKLAQTIRAQNNASGSDASTPDYVAESASIPLGQNEDGSQRYITGFGLPIEDAMSFLGGGVRGGLMEAVSRMNPLVKAPLEWATGESFFQKGPQGGRDLEDLDPTIGRILSNVSGETKAVDLPDSLEFLAANSPLARALTTVRTMTDPRKRDAAGALNLLTGVRVSDVSPGAQDAVIRERSNALMRELGAKAFTRVYFPKDDVAAMNPEEQANAIRLQILQNVLAERAKERKAAKQSP
jgi:hypothetical protein